jgi:ribosomal protein S18 acetylase RimI-like enzyme
VAKRPANRARVTRAVRSDAAALAELHNAVSDRLTEEHGKGHWSYRTTERGVLRALETSRVYAARERGKPVATFTLQTRKPWAIDVAYFTPVERPVYLVGLAVDPRRQSRGLGRHMVAAAIAEAKAYPADAIRLDAYDTPAGASAFYLSRGFRERGRRKYKGTPLRYFEMLLS